MEMEVRGNFKINYVDDSEVLSERSIIAYKISSTKKGKYCIEAMCFKKNAPRKFRNDRIKKCINLDNNQSIENLFEYLSNKEPEFKTCQKFVKSTEHNLLFRIMIYLCMTTGVMKDNKFEKLLSILHEISNNKTITAPSLEMMIVNTEEIEEKEFKSSIEKAVNDNLIDKELLMRYGYEITILDSEKHPKEQRAINTMEEIIFSNKMKSSKHQ